MLQRRLLSLCSQPPGVWCMYLSAGFKVPYQLKDLANKAIFKGLAKVQDQPLKFRGISWPQWQYLATYMEELAHDLHLYLLSSSQVSFLSSVAKYCDTGNKCIWKKLHPITYLFISCSKCLWKTTYLTVCGKTLLTARWWSGWFYKLSFFSNFTSVLGGQR